jgi:hypothetical protein
MQAFLQVLGVCVELYLWVVLVGMCFMYPLLCVANAYATHVPFPVCDGDYNSGYQILL